MRYYQAIFTLTPDTQDARDILAAVAAEAGFESFEDNEHGITGYVQTEGFNNAVLDESIKTFPMPEVDIIYNICEAEDKNWNELWEKEGFEPIMIDGKCVIYDANKPIGSKEFPIEIAIETHQAFGTGTHETTQMMVSAILGMNLKGKRVLDCGCGTGILGIVAAKNNAEEVVGYDIDDWSVKNSEHNAKLNNVEMEVLEGSKSVLSHISGVFDVVLANINRNILLNDMPDFVGLMSHDSKMALSGFYEEDAPTIIAKAEELGLKETGCNVLNRWCCITFEKKS